jgi:hypothetical protein
MEPTMPTYTVTKNGSIAGEHDGVLYFPDDIAFLSRKARKRLAELHSMHPYLEWEGSIKEARMGAQDILIAEGLLKV